MKIVLIVPNFDTYVINPQLGVMYLSSYIKKYGKHNVKIIDALRDNLTCEQTVNLADKENPDIVGIYCLSCCYKEVTELSKMLKNKNHRVVIGGAHPTFMPYTTLQESKADFVICGEGEISLLKLINNNLDNKTIQGVYTLADLKDNSTQIDGNPIQKSEFVENLDDIPFPDWEQLPPSSYPKAPHAVVFKGFPVGVIMTSRGCPFRCTFCSSHNLFKGVRFRSIDNVIQEIKYLVKEFNIKELQFVDDNLTLNKSYAMELCQRMIDENIKIEWTPLNGIRADSLDDELAAKMKEAGCYLIDFGIESATPEILKNIKKGETIETITSAIECAHRAGILTLGNFIFGLPGDTEESLNRAIDYAVKSKLDRAGFFAFNVLPGSEIALSLKKEKGIELASGALFSTPEYSVCELNTKQIAKYIQKAYWKFYFRPRILFNILKYIKPSQYKYFLKILKKYNIFKFW